MTPFTLHEKKAYDWLIDLVVSWEIALSFDEDWDETLPGIDPDWNPLELGETDTVHLLVRAAQQNGMITSPPDTLLTFEAIGSGHEWVFHWFLDIHEPTPLRLATPAEGMSRLGDLEVRGVEAAMAVLRVAVEAANLLAQQLSDHITARTTPDARCAVTPTRLEASDADRPEHGTRNGAPTS
ncbi:hypothetical protein IAG44_40050 [Streptomyces roseirectus]|uniref:Uncharacterized protein n=1 Tax=Streptomyces roseirectus TaxID=2768066 RepID=A0A7H0IQD7_9ACTN|nr:hypothetical protein [Streptomyces roseirectus]QNP75003.1 hypothetical protein IAG44_40050 [Streptomyces roseirectus]